MGRSLPLMGCYGLRDGHQAVQSSGREGKRGSWDRHSAQKLGHLTSFHGHILPVGGGGAFFPFERGGNLTL